MTSDERSLDGQLRDLQERAKELDCLYRVDELLSRPGADAQRVFERLLETIPRGWQFPDVCVAEIVLQGRGWQPAGFRRTSWGLMAPIVAEGETIGHVAVYYTEQRPESDEGPFLRQERRLLNAIAERIGYHVLQERFGAALAAAGAPPGRVVLGRTRGEGLRETDIDAAILLFTFIPTFELKEEIAGYVRRII